MPVYRITDWDRRYETSESRKRKRLDWVAVPNRWDSCGYLAIAALPDGPAVFGAWVLILEVASRCDVRGTLAEGGRGLTPEMIAAKVRMPVKTIRRALEVLCSEDIAWIASDNLPLPAGTPADAAGTPADRAGNLPLHNQTLPNPTGQDRTGHARDKSARFVPPTIEDVQAYIAEKGYHFTAEQFIAYYETLNWIPKGSKEPMTNWRSACVTWESRQKERGSSDHPQFSPKRPTQAGAPQSLEGNSTIDGIHKFVPGGEGW